LRRLKVRRVLPASSGGKVLFIGSGPYRVSQETRGNLFAHSCLAYMAEKGIDFVVMDSDAAAPLFSDTPAARYIAGPVDAAALRDVLASEAPSRVWPVCTGKETQALVLALLGETADQRLPGGAGAWRAAVDWTRFRELASSLSIKVPFGRVATSIEQAAAVAGEVGFPVFLSASQSKGGGGARIAYNYEELAAQAQQLISWSLASQVLVVRVCEKDPQCEVHLLRDSSGASRVLGIVDALAPLGVHVGNAASVFPAASLSRETAAAVAKAASALADASGLVGYGVFHFALEGRRAPYAVGMRIGFTASSYMVSAALGLDVGRAATALAFGEPVGRAAADVRAPDRIAVSVPHFDHTLFPGSGDVLGPHKVSTGMATVLASDFEAAFLAAARSALEDGAGILPPAFAKAAKRDTLEFLVAPRVDFLADVLSAVVAGHTFEQIADASGLARVYVEKMAALIRIYQALAHAGASAASAGKAARAAAEAGFSSAEIASAAGRPPAKPRRRGRRPSSRATQGEGAFLICGPPARAVGCVDESDVMLRGLARAYLARGRELVLAGWRGRQPLDVFFSARKVHWGDAADTLRQALESGPVAAVYVDPRNADWESLSRRAVSAGAALASADPDLVAALADRKALAAVLPRAGLVLKEGIEADSLEQARRAVASYGYPVLVRQKGTAHVFVVAYEDAQLDQFFSGQSATVVVERFLEDLVESAVVVLADGSESRAVAVTEVLEEPGISSIDRAGALPPFSITERSRQTLASRAEALVNAVGARGIVTVRLGLRYDVIYYLSATVAAAREVPFVSAALGRDLVAAAAEIFMGAPLAKAWPQGAAAAGPVFIRQPVFSFGRFPGADTVLGTRPRSTGDVVGVGPNFSHAYAAARRSTGRGLPASGTVFISLRDRDKRAGMLIGRQLADLGFKIVSTEGTARALASAGVEARVVHRVSEGRPNVVDLLKNREITMVIYTPSGRAPREDEVQIRTVAWGLGIPVITAAGEALAAVGAIEAILAP